MIPSRLNVASVVTLLIRRNGNPVNPVSWAPHELGAFLACASSDGKISVLIFEGAVPHPTAPLWTAPSPKSLTESFVQMMVSGVRTCSKPMLLGATLCPRHRQLELVHYWQCPVQAAHALH